MKLQNHHIGIGVKSVFYKDLIDKSWDIDFIEGHIENFLDGGFHLNNLKKLSEKYPITLHGVGLSLGSTDKPISSDIFARKKIIDFINPTFFSEHAAWTRFGNAHQNDLLPLPLNIKTAKRVADNISVVQDIIKRNILIENLSAYITFKEDDISEAEFMNEISRISGCKMLLDINNIYVQEHNLGRSSLEYIKKINKNSIVQYHIAGGEFFEDTDIICDTHGTDITDDVMRLYIKAIEIIGMHPTLYERDNNIPSLQEMENQVKKIRIAQKKAMELEYV